MEIIEQHQTFFYVLVITLGLYVTWGLGANDVANAMGTSVGSGAISVRQALLLAGIMELCGAYLAGGEVATTISKGIIDGSHFEAVPQATSSTIWSGCSCRAAIARSRIGQVGPQLWS